MLAAGSAGGIGRVRMGEKRKLLSYFTSETSRSKASLSRTSKALVVQEMGWDADAVSRRCISQWMWKYKTQTRAQAVSLCGTRWVRSDASTGAVSQMFTFLLVDLGKGFSQCSHHLLQTPASSWSRSGERSPAKVSTQSPWLLNHPWTNGLPCTSHLINLPAAHQGTL